LTSSNDRGTVDGITKDAKIQRPTQLLALRQIYYLYARLKDQMVEV
jgi:hypothetical protein